MKFLLMGWVGSAVALGGLISDAMAQSAPNANFERGVLFASFQAFKDELSAIGNSADAAARAERLNTLWDALRAARQVPYAQGDRYVMLYRGPAKSVAFPGDQSGWNPQDAVAAPLTGTDLWYREGALPADARVDYKVVVDGKSWILDPANPLQVWSGMGPNSELRMPKYEFPRESIRRLDAKRGMLGPNVLITSEKLGYDVQYRVYTPAGYEAGELADLPVVYVTDGHEYAADQLGALIAVLDNLIDDGTLRPTIAVFVDPRDPDNLTNNRRITEYNMNPQFAAFVADELVLAIDAAYRTKATADERVILGTSMGGLNAAYFGATQGDVFHKLAIQSPAFDFNPKIYALFEKSPTAPLQIFMTAGTLSDGDGGAKMSDILAKHGYDFTFTQANEGHSWGNWRGQHAAMLASLIGPPQVGKATSAGTSPHFAVGYRAYGENSSCSKRVERRQLRGRRRCFSDGF